LSYDKKSSSYAKFGLELWKKSLRFLKIRIKEPAIRVSFLGLVFYIIIDFKLKMKYNVFV